VLTRAVVTAFAGVRLRDCSRSLLLSLRGSATASDGLRTLRFERNVNPAGNDRFVAGLVPARGRILC